MSYKLSFPRDRETPDEYEPTTPVSCADCGDVYDLEFDLGCDLKYFYGEYLCRECFAKRDEEEYSLEATLRHAEGMRADGILLLSEIRRDLESLRNELPDPPDIDD